MTQDKQRGHFGNGQKRGHSRHQTYDVLLLQRLYLELVLLTFNAAITKDFNRSICFDRVIKSLSGIMIWRAGRKKEYIRCIWLVNRDAKNYVKSAHVISKNRFNRIPTDDQDDESQGIVNTREDWGLLISSMFKTLNKVSFGLKSKSVIGSINVNYAIRGFVDDFTGGTNIDQYPINLHIYPDPTQITELKKCCIITNNKWEKILYYSNDTLELPKSRI